MKKISRVMINKVISDHFNTNPVRLNLCSSGNINQTFSFKIASKEYILRIFNEDWKAKKEEFVYNDIRNHIEIPIPKILEVNTSKKTLPHAYTIMSKVHGENIINVYKKYRNSNIFSEAGEILAKIHNIKFNHYGWIMGNEINPCFDSWHDFVWNDLKYKLEKLKSLPRVRKLYPTIEKYVNDHSYILRVNKNPVLLHKDYHGPHILATKNGITGIIDVEWAIAGHNENDFIKLELWVFSLLKKMRDPFFKGYLKYQNLLEDYPTRKKFYELWLYVNMLNFSFDLKNKKLLESNQKSLEKFLK